MHPDSPASATGSDDVRVVTVTQADREAAAALFDITSWGQVQTPPSRAAQHILDGKGDGSPYVAALARHRLAHASTPSAKERVEHERSCSEIAGRPQLPSPTGEA